MSKVIFPDLIQVAGSMSDAGLVLNSYILTIGYS